MKKLFLEFIKNKLNIALIFFVIAVLLFSFFQRPEQIENNDSSKDNLSADTFIPKGFVLVPIELQNADSISSIIDEYAIIDLYSGNQFQSIKSVLVGKKLRLLRAPLNPKAFAVLVPENEAEKVVSSPGPYYAVIQNKQITEQGFLNKKNKSISKIDYYKKEI